MSDLKLVFQKHDGDKSVADVAPEEYKSIHVMQDDLDELSGKPSASKASSGTASDVQASGSPFLDEIPTAPISGATPEESVRGKKDKGAVLRSFFSKNDAPRQENEIDAIQKKRLLIVIGGASVLVVALIALFVIAFRGNKRGPVANAPLPTTAPATTPPPAPVAPQQAVDQAFSTENPNFLQIDTESANASAEGISAILDATASKVGTMTTSSPVEFLVRDANNNPIAFSRFAHLLGLNIPDDFLSNLDETFSIFLLPEGSVVRRAVIISVKDADKLAIAMKNDEPSLAASFGPLLYGSAISVPASVESHDGAFGSLATRYAIVDQASGASFDHVIFGSRLILGTSKNMFQSVLGQSVRSQSGNQQQ